MDEPDVALVAVATGAEGMLLSLLVHKWTPHQDAVVHTLGQYQVSVPSHTIHIVPMNLLCISMTIGKRLQE